MSQEQKRWGYTVSRWWGFPHYHVSLFPNSTGELRQIFDYRSGVNQHQKFNTVKEANNFVAKVRRGLKKQGVQLRLHSRDYAK